MTLKILSGKFKGRPLRSPSGTQTRPTQGILRAALFNRCQHEIEGADVLDLFAGSGAIGLEALSRGAASATFVERSPQAVSAIRENLTLLGVTATILPCDAIDALKTLGRNRQTFTLIYIDPPYDQTAAYYDMLFALLLPLCKASTRIFLEERAPMSPRGWEAVDRRRYGSALLSEFQPLGHM